MTDRVICYGDIIDDIVVAPRGPIRPDTDTHSLIRMGPGGSAANTAAWLGQIGNPVDFVGVVGCGDAERHRLSLPNATAHLREHPVLQTGRIVVIVQNERRDMLTDRGANVDLGPGDVTDDLLARARLLHLTGHVLLNSAGVSGVRSLIERCRAMNVQVSVSAGSAGYIEEIGATRVREAIAGADILFAADKDGALLAGHTDAGEIARTLSMYVPIAVFTRGSREIMVGETGVVRSFRVRPIPVVDPTGAGDAFSAGFLASWIRGLDADVAVRTGADLATQAVGVMGGRPIRPEGA